VIEKTAQRRGNEDLIRLDIGCGQSVQDGFHGVDISARSDADTVYDLTVYLALRRHLDRGGVCSHYVKHVPFEVLHQGGPREGLFAFMGELYRTSPRTPRSGSSTRS
jgi:hypothetical protein